MNAHDPDLVAARRLMRGKESSTRGLYMQIGEWWPQLTEAETLAIFDEAQRQYAFRSNLSRTEDAAKGKAGALPAGWRVHRGHPDARLLAQVDRAIADAAADVDTADTVIAAAKGGGTR